MVGISTDFYQNISSSLDLCRPVYSGLRPDCLKQNCLSSFPMLCSNWWEQSRQALKSNHFLKLKEKIDFGQTEADISFCSLALPGLCSQQREVSWHLKRLSPDPATQEHQEQPLPGRKTFTKLKNIVKPVEEMVKLWQGQKDRNELLDENMGVSEGRVDEQKASCAPPQ